MASYFRAVIRPWVATEVEAYVGPGRSVSVVDLNSYAKPIPDFATPIALLKKAILTPPNVKLGGSGDLFRDFTTIVASLASIPGRKHLAYLGTHGFEAGPGRIWGVNGPNDIIAACNRANVAVSAYFPFYTVSGWGLAEETGGSVTVSSVGAVEGPKEMFRRIRQDQDQYYVLGYSPARSPEGRYHSLRLKVNRPGLEIRSRKGYSTGVRN